MSSRRNVQAIAFPENLPPSRLVTPKPAALLYLTRLLYGSGWFLVVVYALALFLIRPMLKLQYERRGSYLNHCLDKLNAMYELVAKRIKFVPEVRVKYGNTVYSDAGMQTDPKKEEVDNTFNPFLYQQKYQNNGFGRQTIKFEDEEEKRDRSESDRLGGSIQDLKNTLEKLEVSSYKQAGASLSLRGDTSRMSEMQPLMFQVKQLENYMEGLSSEHPKDSMFKRALGYGPYGKPQTKLTNRTAHIVSDIKGDISFLKAEIEKRNGSST
ncbi:hypothetical protein LJB42_003335 [Komagataella kurtzmanii]|nr:hypothetical protein LJB42_003335 [Komagataella kurtzmanii]